LEDEKVMIGINSDFNGFHPIKVLKVLVGLWWVVGGQVVGWLVG